MWRSPTRTAPRPARVATTTCARAPNSVTLPFTLLPVLSRLAPSPSSSSQAPAG